MAQWFARIVGAHTRSVLFLLLVACGTLFFGLGTLPFVGADEPRYARIAQEMRAEGEWITPQLQARPWLEKPPLYYWISRPFLALPVSSETAARLGPACCGLLAALAIFWLGSRLWGPLTGLLGGTVVLTSVGFAAFARGASTDMPMAACFTAAMALLCSAALEPGRGRGRMPAAGFFLGLAVLAKGPIGLVLAAGVALLFWALDEHGGSLRLSELCGALLVCAGVALPWFWLAFRENGFAFVSSFLINHNLARYVSDIHHHPAPFYYYFAVLPGLLFPWTGWLPSLFVSGRPELRRWREWNRPTVYLMCWVAIPLVFFSLSRSKLPGYILPSLPPLALLLGRALAELQEGAPSMMAQRVLAWSPLLMSAAASLGIVMLFQTDYAGSWGIGLAVALPILATAFWGFTAARRNHWARAVQATVLCAVLAIVAVNLFAAPALARRHSTREIARQLVASRARGEPAVTYRFFHHTLDYYTSYGMTANLRDIEGLRRFAGAHSSFLVVTEAARVPELSSVAGCSTVPLGEQGKLRLVRMSRQPGGVSRPLSPTTGAFRAEAAEDAPRLDSVITQ